MIFKRFFCKHEKCEYIYSEFISTDGIHFYPKHRWKCKMCGKII